MTPTRADRERAALHYYGQTCPTYDGGCPTCRWVETGEPFRGIPSELTRLAETVAAATAPLMAELERVREALRKLAIRADVFEDEVMIACALCRHAWHTGEVEQHSPDCAAKEPSDA